MDLSYPIGRFSWEGPNTPAQRMHFINEIAATPGHLRNAVAGLSAEQIETPYRPGGWTVRQVVHHIPDSHLNSYTRFKFALTEEHPMIKSYDEGLWAELEDTRSTPIDVSLALLDALHQRWTTLLRSLAPEEYQRTFQHPQIGAVSLDKNLALYAWHGAHHVGHITSLRERMGWK